MSKRIDNTRNTATESKITAKTISATDRLIPLNQWHNFHVWPPLGGMRHIRFFAEEKGAAHCFVKKGGRVLVRESDFLEWASTSDAV